MPVTSAILKMTCRDRRGIISAVSDFLCHHHGNILTLDEFVDRATFTFFMRVEWDLELFDLSRDSILPAFRDFYVKNAFGGDFELFYSDIKPKMAIFVSRYDHCLYDLLLRHKAGELKCHLPVIVSNHKDLRSVAADFYVPYRVVEVTPANKTEAERIQLDVLKEFQIDFVVLARYMQVLSSDFVARYGGRIINIHHSFLPAFEGAKPYHQAFEKGVKLIGATAHFVDENLDKGPIIHQGTIPISHEDNVDDLITKGRDIEKKVLSDAVKMHLGHRIFLANNRTVIL